MPLGRLRCGTGSATRFARASSNGIAKVSDRNRIDAIRIACNAGWL
jgi:hypothetical protein